MIEYGMPTLIETNGIRECAEICRDLGLQFIELNMNMPMYQTDKLNVSDLAKTAENFGIYYTIHLDENLNVSDFNKYVADAYIKTVTDTVKIAKQLNVPILNMHLSRGVYFTLPDRKVFLFERYKEIYLKSMISFRNECEKAIGNSGIRILIENCEKYEKFQLEAIKLLLESPVFGLTFDIGHDHSVKGINESFILENLENLHHMHIHDALGDKNHLALGTGEINLPKYLKIANEHNCRAVIETKTINALRESVKYIKQYFDN